MYTATDKHVDKVTDDNTDIEMDTNSAEDMFTDIAIDKHWHGHATETDMDEHYHAGIGGWEGSPRSSGQLPLEKCLNKAGVGFDLLAAKIQTYIG